MSSTPLHAVTGAFGYSGKYIARRLLDSGQRAITLTNSIDRANAFGGQIPASPFNFDRPDELVRALDGVEVLYNTYWVRFNHPLFTHADAVRNTLTLFDAAKRAGVRRVVHVSITNPSEDSPLEYFSGKARLERGLRESGLSYTILRPTVLFGKEDILINNIAWALRHLPVFGVFGDGSYRLQPIYVDDLAELCVAGGAGQENVVVNAIGPETFTYRGMAETIARLIGVRRPILPMPPALGYLAGRAIGGVHRRCDDHARGNCRADGGTALRGHCTNGHDPAHRLDHGTCRHVGPALHQRARPAPRPECGLSEQLSRWTHRFWTDCIYFNKANGTPHIGSPRLTPATWVPGCMASSTWPSRTRATRATGIGARAGHSPAWTRLRRRWPRLKRRGRRPSSVEDVSAQQFVNCAADRLPHELVQDAGYRPPDRSSDQVAKPAGRHEMRDAVVHRSE